MNPPGVVKIHIMLDTKAELRQADIVLDFDVLIFQRPPETLQLYHEPGVPLQTLSW